jgi:glycosyltransferase involved in cell wall biosynthesis
VALGRLHPQKGFDVLVEALGRVPDAALVIAGEGDERAALEAQARRLGVEDRVVLAGYRDDVPDLLAAADAAVFSSRFEGSPLSVIECMATGTAIVATRVGGVPELLEDGEQALLVPPEDARALAAALGRVIAEPELRERLGNAARARQRSEFAIDPMLDRVIDLYERLLHRAESRTTGTIPPLPVPARLRRLGGR